MVELRCKALVSDTDFGFAMMREILSRTRLTDTKRLYEIVAQVKSRLQMYLTGSGHSAAAVRAMAEFSDSSWVTDQISGIAFYGLIEQLEKHFEEKKDQIVENLKLVMQYVLRPENLIVSCTSERTPGTEGMPEYLTGSRENQNRRTSEASGKTGRHQNPVSCSVCGESRTH